MSAVERGDMLLLNRRDIAANLAAYGEKEAAAAIEGLTKEQYEQIGKIGFRHALDGKNWLLAGCLAAIEVLEGRPRNLRRKRRAWADVPPEYNVPDPRIQDIQNWFEQYSGGEPVTKSRIYNALAGALREQLPHFQYIKKHARLLHEFVGGRSFIDLDYGRKVVHLRFGVSLDNVEKIKRVLFAETAGAVRAPTISAFSANIGPASPHWPCPVKAAWPILGTDGLTKAGREIVGFTHTYVLPYLKEHEDPLRVRHTLLATPGKALEFAPTQTVFAIDHLAHNREWLEADYAIFKERSKNYIPKIRDRIPMDYERVRARWDEQTLSN
jgi:hypothetical protein